MTMRARWLSHSTIRGTRLDGRIVSRFRMLLPQPLS